MIELTKKVDRRWALAAYGLAYEAANGDVAAMHRADVAYYIAEKAADTVDAAEYSAAYRATLTPKQRDDLRKLLNGRK